MNSNFKHLLIGAFLGTLLLPLYQIIGFNPAFVASFLFASAWFFGKEIKDMKTTGFDWNDIIIDYIGWVAGTVWAIINIIIQVKL